MDKGAVKDFFDRLASSWDSNQRRNEEVIKTILDKSEVAEGVSVLDVAAGTGVLFGDYLDRKVLKLTGIDISDKMLEIAKKKFPEVTLICGDAECYEFNEKFDVIMIYNAFPHFPDPAALIKNLSCALKCGGRLTVAHGMSVKEIEKCHSGSAKDISLSLPAAEKTAEIMAPYVDVDVIISNEQMYMVSGLKRTD